VTEYDMELILVLIILKEHIARRYPAIQRPL
jgi:hypothetical protein